MMKTDLIQELLTIREKRPQCRIGFNLEYKEKWGSVAKDGVGGWGCQSVDGKLLKKQNNLAKVI